jgi:hypothetical protein
MNWCSIKQPHAAELATPIAHAYQRRIMSGKKRFSPGGIAASRGYPWRLALSLFPKTLALFLLAERRGRGEIGDAAAAG